MRYFYRSVKNLDGGVAEFCDVFQILPNGVSTAMLYSLTDDYAEIEILNKCTFEEAASYREKLHEREYIADLPFCFSPCISLISDAEKFKNFVSVLTENGLKNHRTVLFFDVDDIYGDKSETCIKNLKRLKNYGIKLCVGGYGKNINVLDVFADIDLDYFRVSSEYILSSAKSLSALVDFCRANEIKLIVDGVGSVGDLRRLKQNGVSLVCGDAVSAPTEKIDREYLKLKPLNAIEREKYAYKFKQDKIIAEQEKLASEGKKLLKQAKHGAIFESNDYIIADGIKNDRKKPLRNESTDVDALIKDNKLPKAKEIKLDESGNRIRQGVNDTLIETIYALLANSEVKDKERRILRELEIAKQKARAKEEEKFVLEQLEAFIRKTEAEKRALCLYKLIPALKERINYLIELDALALEIEQIEFEEKLEAERKQKEAAELKAIEEKARLEAEKARKAEEEKLELERLYVKEKARLEFEYELSLKKAQESINFAKDKENKLFQISDDGIRKEKEQINAVLPPNAGKVVEAVAYDDVFLPAEIEEEVEAAVYAETYIEADGTLKQEIVKNPVNTFAALSQDSENGNSTPYGKIVEQENESVSEADNLETDNNDFEETFAESDKKKNRELKKAEKRKEKEEKHKSKKLRIEGVDVSVYDESSGDNDDINQNSDREKEVLFSGVTKQEENGLPQTTVADESDGVPSENEVLSDDNALSESESHTAFSGDDFSDDAVSEAGFDENVLNNMPTSDLKERAIQGDFIIDLSYDDGDGHYNEEKKWVDSDGEEYNGYFDQKGRWIDYGYYDEEDVWHDNGFYDGEVFIPYGYFDENGDYIKI